MYWMVRGIFSVVSLALLLILFSGVSFARTRTGRSVADYYLTHLSTIPAAYQDDMLISGETLFLCSSSTLLVYDVSERQIPVLTDSLALPLVGQNSIAKNGNCLFVGGEDQGILVFDTTDPQNLVEIALLFQDDVYAHDFATIGDTLFVAAGSQLRAYDVSDLDNPQEVFTWPAGTDQMFMRVDSHDTWILAAEKHTNYGTVNIYFTYSHLFSLAPEAPVEHVAEYSLRGVPWSVALTPKMMFTYTYEPDQMDGEPRRSALYDWTDPAEPELVVEQEWGWYDAGITSISQHDSLLVTGSDELLLYEWIEPGELDSLLEAPDLYANQVFLDYPYVYIMSVNDVSIHELWNDVSVDESPSPNNLPEEFSLSGVWPNPFNKSATVEVHLAAADELSLTVHNVAGQQVAELVHGTMQAGVHQHTFDASNLASGLYFIQATVPGHLNQVQKVMLVR